MATTFYCGNLVGGKARNCSQRVGYLLSRPRGGLKTATRALVKELVQMARTRAVAAAFGVFSRLEVTHVNVLFRLFAHIAFHSPFQAAQRLETATRALVKELVQMARTRAVTAAF